MFVCVQKEKGWSYSNVRWLFIFLRSFVIPPKMRQGYYYATLAGWKVGSFFYGVCSCFMAVNETWRCHCADRILSEGHVPPSYRETPAESQSVPLHLPSTPHSSFRPRHEYSGIETDWGRGRVEKKGQPTTSRLTCNFQRTVQSRRLGQWRAIKILSVEIQTPFFKTSI